MAKKALSIGDRIVYRRGQDIFHGPRSGQEGTIISFTSGVGIQFDDPFPYGHSCGNSGKDGHCWWADRDHIYLLTMDSNAEAKRLLRK